MSNRTLNRVANIALILFVFFAFTKFLVNLHLYFAIATICTMSLGGMCLVIGIKNLPKQSVLHVAWFGTILLGLVTALSSRNETLISISQFIGNLGLAIVLAKSPPRLSTQIVISLTIIFFFSLKIFANISPDDIFAVSRNYISVIVVLVASLYYIACENEKTKPSIIIALAFLAIAMWAIGRAGMASAAVFVVGALLYKANGRVIALASVLASSVVFGHIPTSTTPVSDEENTLSVFLVGIERIESLGSGGQRDLINSQYFQRLLDRPSDILFGSPLEKVQAIVEVDGNPHNSYINLHITYGAIGVCIFFFALIVAYAKLFRRRKYLTLLALTASLFRSAFDSAAFHGPLDVIIFYCIFSAFIRTKFVFGGINVKTHENIKNADRSIPKYLSSGNISARLDG